MQNHPPVIVHRAGIGLLAIYTVGTLLFGLATLVFDLLFIRQEASINDVVTLLALTAALDLAIVYLSVYVYTRSVFIFTPQLLTVISQNGLFRSQKVDCPLADLQDVKVLRPGLLSNIFNFGTLVIQVSNDTGVLTLPTISDPDHWANYLLQAHQNIFANTSQ